MNNILIIIYFIIAISIFLAPVIVQYFISIKLDEQSIFSIYGIYLLIYTLIQMIMAILNNKYYKEKYNDINEIYKEKKMEKYNIICVGYKEDEILFKNCLESIKKIEKTAINLNKIYIIIDSLEDEYMEKIYKETFKEGVIIRLNGIVAIDGVEEIKTRWDEIQESRVVCITQKHHSKRAVLYTGFKCTEIENIKMDDKITSIICTDSDTEIEIFAPEIMFNELYNDKKIGAITGDLRILKEIKDKTFYTLMSSVRYWFAFNVERAYQSYKGSVLCVSGPLGMYNSKCIEFILEDWFNQKYLGKECSYGDDRHLTNKILSLGEKVIYNPEAKAYTETPETMIRLFKQQTRWNRSANRELIWNLMYLKHIHLSILIDLIYIFFYPLIVVGYLLYILFKGSIYQFAVYISIIIVVGILKGIYGIILEKVDKSIIFYLSYSYVYFTIIIPARLYAIISPTFTEWGTSVRNKPDLTTFLDYLPLILWNSLLIGGKCYFIYRNLYEFLNLSFNVYFYIISNSIYILNLILTLIYSKRKMNFKKSV
jgi:hyaluronan synthase